MHRAENVVVSCAFDNGVYEKHSPPPLLPQCWFAYWSEEQKAYYYARSEEPQLSTWNVPPFVSRPWKVYWANNSTSFYFKNDLSGECTMDMPIGQRPVIYSAPNIKNGVVEQYLCLWSAYNAKVKGIEHVRGEEIGTGQSGYAEIQTVAKYGLGDCICVEGEVVNGDVAGVNCSGAGW